jgi:hypothetical protein
MASMKLFLKLKKKQIAKSPEQKYILTVPLILPEADLEGACGACAPLKFAKHMLYNVN